MRTIVDYPRNEAGLVDKFIGTAYDTVKYVADNMVTLTKLYDFLGSNGMLLTVSTEDELKALAAGSKYARVYNSELGVDYSYKDYLFVEGDFTGIPSTTMGSIGSWLELASSSSGGGNGNLAYSWVYNNGSAVGGETTITLPELTTSVLEIHIDSAYQALGYGFEFDAATNTLTLAEPLEEGQLVAVTYLKSGEVSRAVQEVARANNIPDSQVILSTDTFSTLGNKTIIFDTVAQKFWKLPSGIPTTAKVYGVSGTTLVYSPGQVSVTLLPVYIGDVLQTSSGAALVGTSSGLTVQAELDKLVNPEGATLYPSLQMARWRDEGDVRGWGAVADGTTLCDSMFLEAEEEGKPLYVPEGTWRLSSPMALGYTGQYYGPGILKFDNAEWWRRGGSAGTGLAENYTLFYDYTSQADVSVTFDGVTQVISFIDTYTIQAPASLTTTSVKINIANGVLRLGPTPISPRSFNAFADGGRKVAPALPDQVTSPVGMMNTALGATSMPHITTGENNTAYGARSLVSLTSGINNTAIGFQTLYRSTGSDNTAVGSVSGEWVTTGEQNTYVGTSSGGQNKTGSYNTGIGWSALLNNQSGNYNVALGWRAGGNAGTSPFDESVMVGAYCGSFSHGSKNTYVGYRAGCALNSGSDGTENVAVGFFAMRNHNGADYNTAVGVSSLYAVTSGQYNIAIGHSAGIALTTHNQNVLIGYRAGYVLDADSNVLIGHLVAQTTTTGTGNVAIGTGALASNTTGTNNVAIGINSGRLTTAGAATATLTNVITIGSDARCSDSNQLQLGNANVTTYAYGTVQNRSDIRDKIEIADTALGLSFITGLRPVDGRWNYRDLYYNAVTDEDGSVTSTFDQEGYDNHTLAGERKHHWFIAQEVQTLCETLGVEFGGLQHHAVNGGDDVYTLGYDEFIPPIVKAIQEINAVQQDILARLAALEAK